MPYEYDFNQYSPDVQQWLLQQIDDAMYDMKQGQLFRNSAGHNYKILEDSPAGNVYVKVISDYPVNSTRYIEKAVVLS